MLEKCLYCVVNTHDERTESPALEDAILILQYVERTNLIPPLKRDR